MIFFTAGSATIQYAALGDLRPAYATVLFLAGLAGTFTGQRVVSELLKRTGRQSLVVLLIAVVIGAHPPPPLRPGPHPPKHAPDPSRRLHCSHDHHRHLQLSDRASPRQDSGLPPSLPVLSSLRAMSVFDRSPKTTSGLHSVALETRYLNSLKVSGTSLTLSTALCSVSCTITTSDPRLRVTVIHLLQSLIAGYEDGHGEVRLEDPNVQ